MLEKLKIELGKKQITQREVARALQLSDSTMSRIVRGEVRCTARLRRLIATYLKVPPTELFPRRTRHRAARKK